MIESNISENPYDHSTNVNMKFRMIEILSSQDFLQATLKEVSRLISEEIIKHHLPEVLEKISPEAIANMTIASAGAEINKTLREKIPDKILHLETQRENAVVFQKGILGGLKRLS